jgi:hypothetical protein
MAAGLAILRNMGRSIQLSFRRSVSPPQPVAWRPAAAAAENATVTQYPPIHIVSPTGFNSRTGQTPGSVLAAVAPQLGIESALWGELFEVEPGARTGIHHHGEQQTSPTSCRASAKSAGARGANTGRVRKLAISSMCLPSFHTWRSIPRVRSPFAGRW